jgi:hypothetical protein
MTAQLRRLFLLSQWSIAYTDSAPLSEQTPHRCLGRLRIVVWADSAPLSGKVTHRCLSMSRHVIYRHADDADFKGFSQIRKKSVQICINLCHRSSLRGTKQSSVSCSWIASCLAMTNNCVRNNGQSYNHLNHINHSSDN